MPLRQATPNITIGTDIIRTSRLAQYLTIQSPKHHPSPSQQTKHVSKQVPKLQSFLQKVFSPRERKGISIPLRLFLPYPSKPFIPENSYMSMNKEQKRVVQFLASRWAAKEAVIKSHRQRRLYLRDVEIFNDSLTGAAFAIVADSHRVSESAASARGDDKITATKDIVIPKRNTSVSSDERKCESEDSSVNNHEESVGIVNNIEHGKEEMGLQLGLSLSLKELAGEDGVLVQVSISHEEEYCIAVAINST